MKAGELRHKVELEQPVRKAEPSGEIMTKWRPVATVWAAVRPLTGREILRERQVQQETTHEVKLRYRPDVRTDWRLIFNDPAGRHVLNVASLVDTDARHRELVLGVVEEDDA